MGSFHTNTDNHNGVIGDPLVIEQKPGQAYKLSIAVVGHVLCSLGEDGHEGVYPIELIVGDHHEEGGGGFPDCKKVIVSQFPFKRGGGIMVLFEEASDCIGRHNGLIDCQLTPSSRGSNLLGFWSRSGAIEDCNDDNEGNRVDKGKLRVLGAFGDLAEWVQGRDGNGGFGCLAGIKFELDFYCRGHQKGSKMTE
jgi:hypothetical protein